MYKVLIAQRDIKDGYALAKIISKEIKNTEVVVIEGHSKAVIEELGRNSTDILLISLELGGQGGLFVTEQLKEMKDRPFVVMTSEYDNYSVVRNAFRVGVSDYLISPIVPVSLIDSIKKVICQVEEKKCAQLNSDKLQKRIKFLSLFSEYSFIYTILFNGEFIKFIENYSDIFDIDNKGFIVNVEFKSYDDVNDLDGIALMDAFKQELKDKYRVIFGPRILNRICLFVMVPYADADKDIEEQNNLRLEIVSEIKSAIEKSAGNLVRLGVGSVQELRRIHLSYEQAIRSLRFAGSGELAMYSNEEYDKFFDNYEFVNKVKELTDCIQTKQDEVHTRFAELLEMLSSLSFKDRKSKTVQLLVVIAYYINLTGNSEVDFLNYEALIDQLVKITEEELNIWALSRFEFIMKATRESKKATIPLSVKHALKYIPAHYKEDVSLTRVAEECNVSMQYLSKVFKESVGMNFIEYLNQYRIEKAKSMMVKDGPTIKEICFEVGYSNPNYFSRIFKKIEGVTPREYYPDKANNNN